MKERNYLSSSVV